MMYRVQGSGKTVWKKVLILAFIYTLYPTPYTLIYAGSDIAAVEKPFLEGRYDKSVYAAKQLIDQRARQRYEIYYLKGLSELKLGRYKDARESFGAIISKYPGSNRIFDSYIGIGDSYFLEGDHTGAAKAYAQVKEKFPMGKNMALVEARLADCRKEAISVPSPAVLQIERPKTVPASGYFTVQAGCFKNKRNAERLSTKLVQAGYQGHVEFPFTTGDGLYRVKVGKFSSKEEAETTAAKLNRSGYRTKICDDTSCS